MTEEKSRKRTRMIAWIMLVIGVVVTCEGLYFLLTTDSHGKLVDTLLGAAFIALSAVFFAVSKPKTDVID